MIVQALSWVLSLLGAVGLWITGRGDRRGWLFMVAIQPVWIGFDVIVHAYGLILSSVLYAAVAARNLYRKDRPGA